MALQHPLESIYGTSHGSAYTKVQGLTVDCFSNTMDITAVTWANKAARDAGVAPMASKQYQLASCVPASGSNLVEQAYVYLKQGSEWSGSIDV